MLDHQDLVVPTHYGVSEVQFFETESFMRICFTELFMGYEYGGEARRGFAPKRALTVGALKPLYMSCRNGSVHVLSPSFSRKRPFMILVMTRLFSFAFCIASILPGAVGKFSNSYHLNN